MSFRLVRKILIQKIVLKEFKNLLMKLKLLIITMRNYIKMYLIRVVLLVPYIILIVIKSTYKKFFI